MQRISCSFRLITCCNNGKVFGQVVFLHLLHQRFYLIRCFDEVLPAGLDHIQGDDIFAIEAGIAFLLGKTIHYLRYVFQVYCLAILVLDDDITDLVGSFKFIAYAQDALLVAHAHFARSGRYVLSRYGVIYVIKRKACALHFIHVHIYLYLAVQVAHTVYTLYFLHRFYVVLHLVGI